ncbi:Matrilysin [Handroanthus impetiginosus]|uniref:Matrilysin n=1 Tax=Handroanthus impetiginosus TaxID=429701 RepID=A0A2G9HJM0_9LAMI|nr:Matrilysin [Handroanthus impetiginosus]
MVPNICTCIFLLDLFLLNPILISHANSFEKSSPLSFLNNLIGIKKGHKAKGLSKLKKHLSNLGYMDNNKDFKNPKHEDNDLFDDNLELALKKYQIFFHLQVNGILDARTVENLLLPRCGVSDFVNLNKSQFKDHIPTISSHYAFFPNEPKWSKTILTYSFPPNTRSDVIQPMKDATHTWANVTRFKFKYIKDYDHADIKISFQVKDHGDGSPFDGPNGVLAHAFAPPDGRLHFDGDERWVNGVVPGEFDLQTIGLHELGHVLGLAHSSDGGAIMYPSIGSGFRKGLGKDDIVGIRALYHISK